MNRFQQRDCFTVNYLAQSKNILLKKSDGPDYPITSFRGEKQLEFHVSRNPGTIFFLLSRQTWETNSIFNLFSVLRNQNLFKKSPNPPKQA